VYFQLGKLRVATGKSLEKLARSVSLSDPKSLDLFLNGAKTRAGVAVNSTSAMKFFAVYSCIRIIAETLATLPIHVIRKEGDYNHKADTHGGLHLIAKNPNNPRDTSLTAYDMRVEMIANALLRGKSYSFVHRDDRGFPIALEQLDFDDVTEIKDRNGVVFYNVKGRGTVHADDLFIVKAMGGMSPISLHRETIGLGLAQVEFAGDFYANGSHMDGHWSTDQVFEKTETRDAHLEILRDAAKSGNFQQYLFEGGLKWNPMSLPQKDAQFIETKKMNATEICSIYGVPPSLIFIDTQQKYSNAEEQNRQFVNYTLQSWAQRFEGEANRKLLLESEKMNHEFTVNMHGLLRGDVKTQTEHFRVLASLGVYSVNDILKMLGRNPVEGGDERFVQINQIPLADMPAYAEGITDTGDDRVADLVAEIRTKLNGTLA
jgi:HK97 family phage portal protein